MLPTAPLPSTRLNVEDTLHLQPVRPTTQVIDVLSELQPGQKIIAMIQAQLANGAYRATIAQRDVTLALPFSAKPGDSLNLEVVETQGRIAFAVTKPGADAAGGRPSATTILSGTGQLIGQLLSAERSPKEQAAVLNANRPVLSEPAAGAAANAPALQRAIAQSGLFYESHQSAWASGRLPESSLRAEPQAMLARSAQPAAPAAPGSPAQSAGPPPPTASAPGAAPPQGMPSPPEAPWGPRPPAKDADPAELAGSRNKDGTPASATDAARPAGARLAVPAELAPIVQQQLSSLANNVYAFQGLLWAGQPFHWEIVDDDAHRRTNEPGDPERPWTTRLKLLLPSLGDIDATIRLEGGDLKIDMASGTAGTPEALRKGRDRLRERMELAGLRLMALDIRNAATDDEGGDHGDG